MWSFQDHSDLWWEWTVGKQGRKQGNWSVGWEVGGPCRCPGRDEGDAEEGGDGFRICTVFQGHPSLCQPVHPPQGQPSRSAQQVLTVRYLWELKRCRLWDLEKNVFLVSLTSNISNLHLNGGLRI